MRRGQIFLYTLVIMASAAMITGVARASVEDGLVVQDPHFGAVLFDFYQQDHFKALTRLVTVREQQRVPHHEAEAELLQGGLLLSWGQHREAGEIFERLLTTTADQSVRDRTWFYLAKVRYQRGHMEAAEAAFKNVQGPLPAELDAERHNLLARIYIDQGRFDAAVELLSRWQGDDTWSAYARYNLGVALVRGDSLDAGATLLDQVGTLRVSDEEMRSLRDKANLALGFALLQAQRDAEAKPVLQRVRLNGPFSSKALLGAGWADAADAEYQRALVKWLELRGRDVLDSAVQESLLAVPYAFAQLGATAQAAEHYAHALDTYASELERLDTVIAAARSGRLLETLLQTDTEFMGGWYWELEQLPASDGARYLHLTIGDHRFHEGLKSYRDLRALSAHLTQWQEKLDTYRDMVATREQAYASRLPEVQARLATVDRRAMQNRRQAINSQLSAAREQRDVVALATATEQAQWRRLEALERSPALSLADSADLRRKHRVLKGVLLWNMDREYRLRVWRQQRAVDELDEALKQLDEQQAALNTTVASLDSTVSGFAGRIDALEPAIRNLQARLNRAMQQYSAYLNGIAVAELQDQQQRMATYRSQARFALATIYDRMAAQNTGVAQP